MIKQNTARLALVAASSSRQQHAETMTTQGRCDDSTVARPRHECR